MSISRKAIGLHLCAMFLLAVFIVACAGPVTTAPTAAPTAASAAKEIVVGAIYPMSGAEAQIGVDAKAAIDLAVEIVNGKFDLSLPLAKEEGLPNLGGAKIRVVYGDHRGSPEKGQSEAERLITQEGAVALIGTYFSSVSASASATAERYSVPFLVPESTASNLHKRGLKFFFRTTPHNDEFGEVMFKFMADVQKKGTAKLKKVALLYENTDFGVDMSKGWKSLAAAQGYEVVADLVYTQNSTSLNAEALRIKAAQPDVLLISQLSSDAILFVKTLREIGYVPPMVIANDAGNVEPNFIDSVGKDAEGFISRAVWSPELAQRKPIIDQINKLFKERTGKDLADNSSREFQGMMVLLDAINRGKSRDPKVIRDALLATDLKSDQLMMPWPGVKFDPATGQNTLSTPIMIQLQAGTYKAVWPDDIASVKLVYPIPGWSARQ